MKSIEAGAVIIILKVTFMKHQDCLIGFLGDVLANQ